MHFDNFFYPKNTFSVYLFLISIPLYFFLRPYSEYTKFVFAAIIILFVFSSKPLIVKYIRDITFTKIESIELVFISYLSLIFVIGNFSDLYLVKILIAYICSRLLFASKFDSQSVKTADALVVSSTLAAFGVMLGALEIIFLDTSYFSTSMSNYPYFDESRTLLGGFFYNHNGAAYCIATGIACINLTSKRLKSYRIIVTIILISAFIMTLSKFTILCTLIGFTFVITHKIRSRYLVALILLIALSYCFFSSVIVARSGSYAFPNMHYREILFSVENIDFILGYYGYQKLILVKMLTTNLIIPFGTANFITTYGEEPHLLFGSLLFSAGLIPWLALLFFVTLVVRSFLSTHSRSQHNVAIYTVLCAFLIESLNWDFGDSFYFWILISAILSLTVKRTQQSLQINPSTKD